MVEARPGDVVIYEHKPASIAFSAIGGMTGYFQTHRVHHPQEVEGYAPV
ncbi:MAG TPA: hypothetical protein GX702_15290 [Chloroflexi bacterium]|nr:hypothetical protein [Chloroflexota bacterium]